MLVLPGEAAAAVTVTVTVGDGGSEPDAAPEDTPGVPDAEVLPAEAEVPGEAEVPDEADVVPVPVGELVTVGMIVGVEDEPEVQAETATGPSRARAAQHSAVSLAPNGVPAVVPRTFMALLLRRADDVSFPAHGGRNRNQKGNA